MEGGEIRGEQPVVMKEGGRKGLLLREAGGFQGIMA